MDGSRKSAEEIAGLIRSRPAANAPDLSAAIVSEPYKDVYAGGRFGIRPDHALNAARAADVVQAYDLGDGEVVILTCKRLAVGDPYTVGLEILQRAGKPASITSGFRHYGPPTDDPTALFADFVHAFGRLCRFGGLETTNFLDRLAIPAASAPGRNEMMESVDAEGGRLPASHKLTSSLLMTQRSGTIQLQWGYLIDVTECQAGPWGR